MLPLQEGAPNTYRQANAEVREHLQSEHLGLKEAKMLSP